MTCECEKAVRLRRMIEEALVALETNEGDIFSATDILQDALDERSPKEKEVDGLIVALRLFVKDPPPKERLARERWDWVVSALSKVEAK
jgi:hypothetical protein